MSFLGLPDAHQWGTKTKKMWECFKIITSYMRFFWNVIKQISSSNFFFQFWMIFFSYLKAVYRDPQCAPWYTSTCRKPQFGNNNRAFELIFLATDPLHWLLSLTILSFQIRYGVDFYRNLLAFNWKVIICSPRPKKTFNYDDMSIISLD